MAAPIYVDDEDNSETSDDERMLLDIHRLWITDENSVLCRYDGDPNDWDFELECDLADLLPSEEGALARVGVLRLSAWLYFLLICFPTNWVLRWYGLNEIPPEPKVRKPLGFCASWGKCLFIAAIIFGFAIMLCLLAQSYGRLQYDVQDGGAMTGFLQWEEKVPVKVDYESQSTEYPDIELLEDECIIVRGMYYRDIDASKVSELQKGDDDVTLVTDP